MVHKLTKLETAKNKLIKLISSKNCKTKVSVNEATQRINYNLIKSTINLPETLNSAVDGYGILHKSLIKNPKTEFEVVGVAKAGFPFNNKIKINQAIEIYTGSVLPKGVDTVVMQENCKRKGSKVIIKEDIKVKQNVRPIGENLKKGELIVKKGEILNSSNIGQLSASGINKIEVYDKIKISIISTGNELIDSRYSKIINGQIYDSNRPMLKSLFQTNNTEIIDMGIVKDNRSDLASKYLDCLSKSDVVISTGGASEGVEDHTQNALRDIGAESLVWQLAMKPGKPMGIGMIQKKLIFCLPGNPVAAFVCSKLLINPIINKLAGGINLNPVFFKLPSGFEHKKKIGRTEFLRAKINNSSSKSEVILHGRKGAGVISSLIGADGLVEIPYDSIEVKKGELLKFYPFDHRSI